VRGRKTIPAAREKFGSDTLAAAKKSKRAARTLICKNCGGEGHFAKTCQNPARLPDAEIQPIAKEEHAELAAGEPVTPKNGGNT
jgi:Zinc knuckle